MIIDEYFFRKLLFCLLLLIIGIIIPLKSKMQQSQYNKENLNIKLYRNENELVLFILILISSVIILIPGYMEKNYLNILFVFSIIFIVNSIICYEKKIQIDLVEITLMLSILMTSVSFIWWERNVFSSQNWPNLIGIAVICSGLFWLPKIRLSKISTLTMNSAAVLGVLAGSIWLFTSTESLIRHDTTSLWHHLSAYVGPAELIAAGVIPLVDIPLQYGAGYTILATSLGCATDCWSALINAQHITNLVWATSLAGCCIVVARKSSATIIFVGILSFGLSFAVLTNLPSNLLPALGAPSTKGMRFWPLALMTAYALIASRYGQILHRLSLPRLFGHCMWLVSAAWSPEAAIHATILWAGTLLWLETTKTHNTQSFWRNLTNIILEFFIVLAIGLVSAVYLFYLNYQELPRVDLYLVYMLTPWGGINIRFPGTIVVIILFLIIGIHELVKRIEYDLKSNSTRDLYIVLVSAILSISYYINRPHENNFLNIFIYFVPALLAVASTSRSPVTRNAFYWVLALPIIWTPFFGAEGLIRTFSTKLKYEEELSRAWSLSRPENATIQMLNIKTDHKENFDELTSIVSRIQRSGKAYSIMDSRFITDGEIGHAPWSIFRSPSAWAFLAPEIRRESIKNVATRLQRGGWLIVLKGEKLAYRDIYSSNQIFSDMGTAYDLKESVRTQHYITNLYETKK